MKLLKLFLIILFIFTFNGFAFAQSTPEELSTMIVEAINSNNQDSYKDLIHPASLEKLEQSSIDEKLKRHIDKSIPNNYELIITNLSEDINYDPKTKTYNHGGFMTLYFPVNPTHRLTFQATFDTTVLINGVEQKTKETSSIFDDMIVESNGRWYLVWQTKEVMNLPINK